MQYAPPPNLCILRDARMITQASVANTALLSCIIHAKAKFRKQAVEREINEEKDLMKMQMQFEFLNQMHPKIRFSFFFKKQNSQFRILPMSMIENEMLRALQPLCRRSYVGCPH